MLYSATTLKMGGGLCKRVNIDDNSTNINTTYNYLSPQNIENKIILRWKFRFWLRVDPKMWRTRTVITKRSHCWIHETRVLVPL